MASVTVENNTFRSVGVARPEAAASAALGMTIRPDYVTAEQYASERLGSAMVGFSNPPFELAKTRSPLVDSSPVLRGYIRRSDIDGADDSSRYRLYFMYNPETIQRSYMSYLDQAALDPYNTEFGSNNMAAAPAILDFSFDLMFDRHLEVSHNYNHPGIKVDYDYFDLVVRGVVPDVPNNGNAIPDNGVMMVNPRNVAVIFGPELAVHGRPYNARVRFERFNNRMTPTRMTISITMKAFYIGPVSTLPSSGRFSDERAYTATIPYDETVQYAPISEQVQYAKLVLTTKTSAYTANNSLRSTPGGVAAGYIPDPSQLPGGGVLTPDEMADLVVSHGLRGDRAAIAISIAYRESKFNTQAQNLVPPDHSIGLFQINQLAHKGAYGTDEQLKNPLYAMAGFMRLSSDGSNFKPWYVNQDGSPTVRGYDLVYLSQARNLVRARNAY